MIHSVKLPVRLNERVLIRNHLISCIYNRKHCSNFRMNRHYLYFTYLHTYKNRLYLSKLLYLTLIIKRYFNYYYFILHYYLHKYIQ